MRITVPTTGTGAQGDGYRPDLPEGITGSNPEYSADYQTVTVTLPDTPEVEQWAVEQGHHVPARVQPHLLLLAIDDENPAMLDQIMAMAEQDRQIKIALNHAPSIRRDAEMVEQLRQALELSHQQVDELFRAAFVRSV